MKCIIYTKTDGGIAIGMICRADGSTSFRQSPLDRYAAALRREDPDITADEVLVELADFVGQNPDYEQAAIIEHAKQITDGDPELVSFRIGDSVDLPGGTAEGEFDAFFRGAFTDDLPGDQVDVDLPKAREIAHERRRANRDARFAPLDIEATIPAKAEQAEAARQAIRDEDGAQQQSIDAAKTPEALKILIGG